MNSIRLWYLQNQSNITWFIIGWMSFAFLIDFSNGNWTGCLIDAFLITVNYYVNKL